MGVVAEQLLAPSGLRSADISTAFVYDHFTPFVLMQLEELGFCARAARRRTSRRWSGCHSAVSCRSNTSGGLLGEAYIHGMNGITECVRQVRGTAVNQVADVEHVLVTAGRACRRAGSSSAPTDSPGFGRHVPLLHGG